MDFTILNKPKDCTLWIYFSCFLLCLDSGCNLCIIAAYIYKHNTYTRISILQIINSEFLVVILQILSYTSQLALVYSLMFLQFDSLIFTMFTTLLEMLIGDIFVKFVFKICRISRSVFSLSIGWCLYVTIFQIPSFFSISASHILVLLKKQL